VFVFINLKIIHTNQAIIRVSSVGITQSHTFLGIRDKNILIGTSRFCGRRFPSRGRLESGL